jgi:hypothetical protein
MIIGFLNIFKRENILRMEKTTKWSNVCKKKQMKINAQMLKVSKKNAVVLNCSANFNRFTVVDCIFCDKFLQSLNCYAVKGIEQKK